MLSKVFSCYFYAKHSLASDLQNVLVPFFIIQNSVYAIVLELVDLKCDTQIHNGTIKTQNQESTTTKMRKHRKRNYFPSMWQHIRFEVWSWSLTLLLYRITMYMRSMLLTNLKDGPVFRLSDILWHSSIPHGCRHRWLMVRSNDNAIYGVGSGGVALR